MIRKLYRFAAGLFAIATMAMLGTALYLEQVLPDRYYVAKGEQFSLGSRGEYITCGTQTSAFPLAAYSAAGNTFKINLKLMGLIDIKDVSVQVVDRRVVSLCGTPFGIKLVTDGVMVVGMGNVQATNPSMETSAGSESAALTNPAKDAGIEEGDVIISIDGNKVESKQEVSEIVDQCTGQPVQVTVRRNDEFLDFSIQPVKSAVDNRYHIGLWVRDSSAGIGTMTFYDPERQAFAGLGHAICDVDTGQIMPLSQGEIVEASITGIKPGRSGTPGELQGSFVNTKAMGELVANSYNGVYGTLYTSPLYAQTIPMALSQEVREGPAKVVTTVAGEKPRYFDITIEKVSLSQDEPTKNMVVRIVDPDLLALSGGIVQGMSGSPIIQNGMLVGAVTHVFVNDPTRGYGIFAENMNDTLISTSSSGSEAMDPQEAA